jgi:hypothetical protein
MVLIIIIIVKKLYGNYLIEHIVFQTVNNPPPQQPQEPPQEIQEEVRIMNLFRNITISAIKID